jgi:hypothetical protein
MYANQYASINRLSLNGMLVARDGPVARGGYASHLGQ